MDHIPISYLDPNIPTIVRCFKARDGNGWQVSQQHTIAWRLAEYIVRRRRRLQTGGEAAARQWRRRHTAQQAGRGGNGGPDRVHCQAPATADTIGAPSTQTRPKASFGRWKAVLLCTLLLLPPSAACRHCCSFLLSLQNAPDLGEATSLVDMAPTNQDPILLCTTTAVTLSPCCYKHLICQGAPIYIYYCHF